MFKIEKEFFEIFGQISEISGFAPGRVNLIGEHTDYTGGMVFPVALNRGTYALVGKRDDRQWRFYSMNFKEAKIITLENDFSYKEEDQWVNYPKSIISTMKDKGYDFNHGLDILYYGNIPNGAGLSSSASIEMVTCVILNEIFSLNLDENDFIEISKLAENNYMGVPCGIMDQFIIGKGKKNHGLLLNTKDLSYEHIPINLLSYEFLIIDSKVERKLSDARYKKVTQAINGSIHKLKEKGIGAINQLNIDDLSTLEMILNGDEYLKIKHIVTENDRTRKAAEAMINYDVKSFGQHMINSHESLKNDLAVSLSPIDYLVEEALELGALGARMTGAGFGGCLVVLIPKEIKNSFTDTIKRNYLNAYNYKADVYEVISDNGTRILSKHIKVWQAIEGLITFAYKNSLIQREDINYTRNQIISLLGLNDFEETNDITFQNEDKDLMLEILVNYKVSTKQIENSLQAKLAFKTALLGTITPLPSQVISRFYKEYKGSQDKATSYFYNLCKLVAYIQEDKNMKWLYKTSFGNLKMTINMSKPEKDPKSIAQALNKKDKKYPKCLLCISNEGYEGRLDHPARQNLRLLPMKIKNESWYFQYSPYAYYEEHGILIHEKHKPMAITENTFMDMLDFVKQIPHYFIGSNADLPIVGGSILSHAHYQFGLKVLPIMDGKDESVWLHNTYKSVQASIVSWPLSVVRFRSKNEAELIKVCQELFNQWEKYEDLSAEIIPYSNGESHNTLTPVCYMKDGDYTFDIILRNNRTSAIYPHGIFHLHEDVHGIKKENIGLIEAMGLAVLPPRLHKEINIIMQHLDHKEIGNDDLNIIKKHDKLIQSLKTNSLLEIQERIGDIFLKGLHDCGVFKVNLKGREYFKDFMSKLSWKERI